MTPVHDYIFKRLIEVADVKLEALVDLIASDILPGNFSRLTSDMERLIAEHFATKFVNENYDKIASGINMERLIKMVELAAIGRTLNK